MDQSHSWEANSYSAGQEISCLLRNPKFHYRVYKSQTLVPIPSQMNPFHNFAASFSKIDLILSSRLRLGLPRVLVPSGLPTEVKY
jgi:hypothetical protein